MRGGWFLLGAAIPACAWWMAGRRVTGVFDRIKLDHGGHADLAVACVDCHGDVSAAGPAPVTEANCAECHEERSDCAMCHDNVQGRPEAPPAPSRITFDHAAHAGRQPLNCIACHRDAEAAADLPLAPIGMAPCLGCHIHQEELDSGRCARCHSGLRDGTVAPMLALEHGGDLLGRHGHLARAFPDSCEGCHREDTCAACHGRLVAGAPTALRPDGALALSFHRAGFLSEHGAASRAAGAGCMGCHGAEVSRTCGDCHRASGIAPGPQGDRTPHPPGYALGAHGEQARQEPGSCAACHAEDGPVTCARCHRPGGIGGSPHLRGWSMAHADMGSAACRGCHGGGGR